ncbi:MAG: UDP-N-acetylmuramate dehydrogenase [Acidobacteriota bacterium]
MSKRLDDPAFEPETVRRAVRLADHCTFEVGGEARFFARCRGDGAFREVLTWARGRDLPILVLGGGSNVLIADGGWPGVVVQSEDAAIELIPDGDGHVLLRAGAAAPWGDVVSTAVDAGLAGIECLAGIPGSVGAAPIQNIGAYGQELAETLHRVRVLERRTGEVAELDAADCGFSYRWSRFKGEWRDRFVITQVELRLRRGAAGEVRYGELRRRLEDRDSTSVPTPAEVRAQVLALRRSKSMVLDPADPNRRSAGSFFLNPVVSAARADAVAEAARRRGGTRDLPRFPVEGADGDRVKLPAAWLIEEAGFHRGYGDGVAGLSSRHTLAIINRGGARARDLIRLAAEVRGVVAEVFSVALEPEPVFVGFDDSVEALLSR